MYLVQSAEKFQQVYAEELVVIFYSEVKDKDIFTSTVAQSAEAVKYTDCISADG